MQEGCIVFIKKFYSFINDIAYCSLKNLIKLRRNRGKRKIILLDTPVHGNLGDHAIALAELNFLRNSCAMDVYEFNSREFHRFGQWLSKQVTAEDVILVHGGGFIGTLWPREEERFIQILRMFSQNKIVVFPQTVYFEDSEHGEEERKLLDIALSKCKDFTFFVREKRSYEYMRHYFPSVNVCCVPDIVTYLNFTSDRQREKVALFCVRKDLEKTLDPKLLQPYQKELAAKGFTLAYTDTVEGHRITRNERKKELGKKLAEFSRASIVVTDRLHGMLFAAITGTPCLAFDNISQKVSGVYEWVSGLKYISMVSPSEEAGPQIQKVLSYAGTPYDNSKIVPYFESIRRTIEGGMIFGMKGKYDE